ncbi:hypothetical protein A2U01_0054244, partial [Trifolium medium]|nr:hypothetical protein [Trifolium medium]
GMDAASTGISKSEGR